VVFTECVPVTIKLKIEAGSYNISWVSNISQTPK